MAQPRQGHLEAVYSIYGYLKSHHKSTMVFDDGYLNWRDSDFPEYDWTDFYRNTIEDIPPNAPEPRGMPLQINVLLTQTMQKIKLPDAHKRASLFISIKLLLYGILKPKRQSKHQLLVQNLFPCALRLN